jgi:predicted ATPase/DNA-binding SARP family transcriptional activator
MAVELRVLGEVEALVDGQRLDIGHARQRCVLAALLVDVNRPVAVDQLIDRVWADDPPSRARNALAGYLSRLRQLLSPAGEVHISRGPAGYTLTVDALLIDMHEFRHLAAEARAGADPVEAMTLYRQALALWRGEPFAGLDTPWISDVRVSLETELLSVELDRNDAALRTGRHTELLSELEAAFHAHPLDERLAGQVMLAQYRSGRQADALDTYRRTRELLIEELGVEPSPPLRAVHQRILESVDAEPVTAQPRPARDELVRAPSTKDLPQSAYLPRRRGRFIGREREVIAVGNALEQGPLVTLTGVGGVGKTTLALEVAEKNQEQFAHGVRLCELAPLNDGSAVGHALAVTLGLQENPTLGIEATVIDYLSAREMLLVIDNCEHVLESSAHLVDRITRECLRVTVLATSREPLSTSGERVVPVPPLPEEAAAELFVERARASRPDFDPEHEPVGAVAEICRRLDGVPLAIELAAARMRVMSSLDVARRLDRLRLLSGGARGAHPRQQSVTATIDWSYRLLAEPEQALFDRLSVLAGSFDLEAAHGVCADAGAGEDDTLELLAGLVDKSMVTVRGGTSATRYAVLETLRAYGRDRLRENGLHDEYAMRHSRYFTELAERGAAAMHGPDEQIWIDRMAPSAGTTFTSPDYENLRTAFERSMADGDTGLALRLVASLPELIHMRVGLFSLDWAVRAIEAADPNQPQYAAAVGVAARVAWGLGQFSHALALAARADGRVPEPGHSYLAYPGDVLKDGQLFLGDSSEALAHYEAESAAARAIGYGPRLVWTLYNATIVHDLLGAAEAGLPQAREALEVAKSTQNPSTMAMALCAMGRAVKTVDPNRALDYFDQAHELAAPVQNNWLTGVARMEAAGVRAEHDDPATAAGLLLDVLDHWSQGGPGVGAQHWYAMRYVARLLKRLGADADAEMLHRALVGGSHERPAPATESSFSPGTSDVADPADADALALARSSLQRYC